MTATLTSLLPKLSFCRWTYIYLRETTRRALNVEAPTNSATKSWPLRIIARPRQASWVGIPSGGTINVEKKGPYKASHARLMMKTLWFRSRRRWEAQGSAQS